MLNPRNLRNFLTLLAAAVIHFLPAATQANPQKFPPHVLFERIDENLLRKFKKIENNEHSIVFGSSGGDATIALRIADIIKLNRLKIDIAGLCLSACAEVILPAAVKYSHAKLVNLPLIGYHHNSEIYRLMLPDADVAKYLECYNELNLKFLNFRKNVRLKPSSLLYQIKAISPVKSSTNILNNCDISTISIGRSFWFPSSAQLRDIYGLPISQNVCADVPRCFGAAIPMLGEVGEIYLVGEKEYMVHRTISGKKELSFIKNVDLSMKDN